MASFDATLAYSVPVRVDLLIANYTAYRNTFQTIETLRMCHRFGRGEDAHITRLPGELLEHVGGYITDPEFARQRRHWPRLFKCFQGLCRPTNHVSDRKLLRLYDEYLRDDDMFGREDWYTGQGSEYRHPDALVEMDMLLRDELADSPEKCPWLDLHDLQVQKWRREMGVGLHYSTLNGDPHFREHFGLDVFHTHDAASIRRTNEQLDLNGIYPTTIAYLMLPPRFQTLHRFDQAIMGRSDHIGKYDDQWPMETDGGFAAPVEMPRHLSASHVARLRRAFKILGLTLPHSQNYVPPGHTPATMPGSPRSYEYGNRNLHNKEAALGADLMQPKLRMLVKSTTVGSDWW